MRAAIVACAILQRLWSMLSVICVEDRTQNVTTVAALPLGRIANNKMEVIRLNIASYQDCVVASLTKKPIAKSVPIRSLPIAVFVRHLSRQID